MCFDAIKDMKCVSEGTERNYENYRTTEILRPHGLLH